jgi:hypothetical protein
MRSLTRLVGTTFAATAIAAAVAPAAGAATLGAGAPPAAISALAPAGHTSAPDLAQRRCHRHFLFFHRHCRPEHR